MQVMEKAVILTTLENLSPQKLDKMSMVPCAPIVIRERLQIQHDPCDLGSGQAVLTPMQLVSFGMSYIQEIHLAKESKCIAPYELANHLPAPMQNVGL